MQLHHTYRDFSLQNRVFKGQEAWVNSQGESTQFAKDFADRNPAELRADVEALKKAVQEKTTEDLGVEKIDIIRGVSKIIQEGKNIGTEAITGSFTLTQGEAVQGLIALIQAKFPEYLKTTAIVQLAYKWMIGQNPAVNFLKTGDTVTFEKGFLSVKRAETTVMDHVEILPMDLLLGNNPDSSTPTTTVPAEGTTTVPAEGTTTVPAEETTTVPAEGTTTVPAEETTTVPAEETTGLNLEFKTSDFDDSLSERNAKLKAAREVDMGQLLENAQKAGLNLAFEDRGPDGNNRIVTVSKGTKVIGHITSTVPLGIVPEYDQKNNVNILTQSMGRTVRSKTPVEGLDFIIQGMKAAPANQESENMSQRDLQLKQAWEDNHKLLTEQTKNAGVTFAIEDRGPHGNNKIVNIMKGHEIIGSMEFTVPLGLVPAYEQKYNVNIITRSLGQTVRSETLAKGLELILKRPLILQSADNKLLAELAPVLLQMQTLFQTEAATSLNNGSNLIVSRNTPDSHGNMRWSVSVKEKTYTVDVKTPADIKDDFEYTLEKGVIIEANGNTYESVPAAIKATLMLERPFS